MAGVFLSCDHYSVGAGDLLLVKVRVVQNMSRLLSNNKDCIIVLLAWREGTV